MTDTGGELLTELCFTKEFIRKAFRKSFIYVPFVRRPQFTLFMLQTNVLYFHWLEKMYRDRWKTSSNTRCGLSSFRIAAGIIRFDRRPGFRPLMSKQISEGWKLSITTAMPPTLRFGAFFRDIHLIPGNRGDWGCQSPPEESPKLSNLGEENSMDWKLIRYSLDWSQTKLQIFIITYGVYQRKPRSLPFVDKWDKLKRRTQEFQNLKLRPNGNLEAPL